MRLIPLCYGRRRYEPALSRRARLLLLFATGTAVGILLWCAGPASRPNAWRWVPWPQFRDDMGHAARHHQAAYEAEAARVAAKECAPHRWPYDHVVYEEGPLASRQQWATPGVEFTEEVSGRRMDRLARARVPHCLTTALHLWFSPTTGAAFVHRMRAPGGAERLLAVLHRPDPPRGRNGEWPSPTGGVEIVRGDRRVNRAAGVEVWCYYQECLPKVGPGQVLRVYAGQADPQDPSHFTVRYEIDGTVGIMDGRLQDDMNLHFRIRDGRLGLSATSPR